MLNNSRKVKYSIILWTAQDLKVGITNSICVVKCSMLQTFLISRSNSLCLPSSNFIDCFQSHLNIKQFTWNILRENIIFSVAVHNCLRSFCLLGFIDIFAKKSTASFFDSPCSLSRRSPSSVYSTILLRGSVSDSWYLLPMSVGTTASAPVLHAVSRDREKDNYIALSNSPGDSNGVESAIYN